jgi:predicted AAA+ superfamily ATPase
VIEETIRRLKPDAAYFWATRGAELDLLLRQGPSVRHRVKMQDAPTVTPSMRIAMQDLRLDRLGVVYPGGKAYSLDKNIEVLPLVEIGRLVAPGARKRR